MTALPMRPTELPPSPLAPHTATVTVGRGTSPYRVSGLWPRVQLKSHEEDAYLRCDIHIRRMRLLCLTPWMHHPISREHLMN
ncbi:hypothetical protein SCALM49S_05013 [Streptomyces californicus]